MFGKPEKNAGKNDQTGNHIRSYEEVVKAIHETAKELENIIGWQQNIMYERTSGSIQRILT